MRSLYRIRPCNQSTKDEITKHYLWFSRRCGFKDENDANIGAFLDNNEVLLKAFQSIFTSAEINVFREKMDCTGICCFTENIPSINEKKHFPKSQKCVCIEYDKESIENFFINSKYALGNCFCDVLYIKEPIVFEEDDKFHILSEITEDGYRYDSILALAKTEKGLDKLVKLLLTRINTCFHFQHEKRIILGGRKIPSYDKNVLGYKVEIPEKVFKAIHIYKDTPQSFIKSLTNKIPIVPI